MNTFIHVVCITLFVGAAGCALDAVDEVEEQPVGDEAPLPPSDEAVTPQDESPVGEPPTEDVATADAPRFVDACTLPGSVKVSFSPTGSIDAHDEGVTRVMNLPFPFKLYGKSYTQFWITTNGQLGFGSTVGGSEFGQVSCPLADTRFKTPILLVYSADLVGRLDGDAGVCFATRGLAPRRKLVVTWKDSFHYDAWLTSHVTFSATLHEATNVVDVAIARNEAPTLPALEDGTTMALGHQSGGAAQAFSCHQPKAPAGTLVRYSP